MVKLGILQCPVCEKVYFYQQEQINGRNRLKNMASNHLSSHRLDESKHGIYRVIMADKSGQLEVSDATDTALRDWISPDESLPRAIRSKVES